MTVYVAWVSELPEPHLPGPWTELRVAAPGLLLVESDDTLSRVFHELKWALSEDAAAVRRTRGRDPEAARPRARDAELAARADRAPLAATTSCQPSPVAPAPTGSQ